MYNDRSRRWVDHGDRYSSERSVGPPRTNVVVRDGDIKAHHPPVLSSDDARWLGARLIEAAALAEVEAVVDRPMPENLKAELTEFGFPMDTLADMSEADLQTLLLTARRQLQKGG